MIKRIFRITGLMSLISYMTVILFVWIYANIQGYQYFSAGEPNSIIKYSEWVLGLVGIVVAVDCLYREVIEDDKKDKNSEKLIRR